MSSATSKLVWSLTECAGERAELRARIVEVCADIDVWRDEWPGTTLCAVTDRLGGALDDAPLPELQAEYGRLLKQASRHGLTEEEAGI